MPHGLLGALALIGICLVVLVVIELAMEQWDERQDRRKQRRPIGFIDELEARSLQRERKRQVISELRMVARQTRRAQGDRR